MWVSAFVVRREEVEVVILSFIPDEPELEGAPCRIYQRFEALKQHRRDIGARG
jgi:hypothetical protein